MCRQPRPFSHFGFKPGSQMRLKLCLNTVLRAVLLCAALLSLCCVARAQGPTVVRPQARQSAAQRLSFRADSYDVYASLFPATQSMNARATVEFQAGEASRFIECELHPDLRISAVHDSAGRPLEVERDGNNSSLIHVTLPDDVPAGQKVTVTFEYSGILANDEQGPYPGVHLARIAADGSFLLQPAQWFPLTGSSNRYIAAFHIEVPQGEIVAGTGVSDGGAPAAPARVMGPQPASAGSAPGRVVYNFRVDTPEAAGSFVAGALKLTAVKAQGLTLPVYAPAAASASVDSYGDAAARILEVFSDQFGALPQPNLTIAQLPDGGVESYAGPGLLLVSQRMWDSSANEPVLANLVAAQWWGNQVMAASPSDAWLTDGLSRYSEGLYVEQSQGKGGMDKLIDQFAVGSLMYEGSTAIADAGRLVPYTSDYNSVVVDKGAMVFHMLRGQMGDSNFLALLRDFYSQFAGKTATLADFEHLAEARSTQGSAGAASQSFVLKNDSGPQSPDALPASAPHNSNTNLGPFFAQWLHSNGVPEFNLTYTVYRIKSGFRIVGKVDQNLDFFNMPVELEVRTEGNPELKIIQVTGLESSFEVDVSASRARAA